MAPTRFLINAEGILIKFNLMDSVWQGRQRGNNIIVSDWSSGRDVVFHFHYFVAYNCKPKQWLFNISYNLEGALQPAPASVETDCAAGWRVLIQFYTKANLITAPGEELVWKMILQSLNTEDVSELGSMTK